MEDKINRIATSNVKSKRYLNFKAINKNIIKKGKQNKLYSFKNFLSLILDLKNWSALIVIETGIKMFMVFAKIVTKKQREGVPNNNNPTKDWLYSYENGYY